MDRDDEIFLILGQVKANTESILKVSESHEKRIAALEHERTKIYSIAGVVGFIGTIFGFFIDKVWK